LKLKNTITDIPGLRVGHAQDEDALTGCTVLLCESGAVGGVDQRGGAPGTRETDALHPLHLVQQVHAVVLAGGSAFGLDAAGGVVRYLEERGVGFDVGVAKVPIVPAAILFDLGLGRADVRPDAAMGYRACQNASSAPPAEGNAGAGMGATVGKALGMAQAMKGGIGCSSVNAGGGVIVAAMVAVNAFGDIINPSNGQLIAGARQIAPPEEPFSYVDALTVLRQRAEQADMQFHSRPAAANTVIGVVATNALLTKEGANKVAQMAQDGVARTVRPAHTMLDGDTLFALSLGSLPADVNTVGAFAAEAVVAAILNAVRKARSAGGVPGLGDKSS